MGRDLMCIIALADDMTGALEIGAKFSAVGISALVSAKPVPASTASVVVFDTETRHCTPEAARSEVLRFVRQSGAASSTLVYKKTDSTLRGNIGAELEALAELYPRWQIGYAPAYPALGRTVKSGVLYVNGIPVSETEFARDALNPVRASAIAAILRPALACTIFDGETDEHLADAARTILSHDAMRIAAGPAGLAEMIAAQIDVPRGPIPVLPTVRTCLVMNGSRHERSARQMRGAESAQWRVLPTEHEPGVDPAHVAAANAKRLARHIAQEEPDAVFVIGGDTVFALVQALGNPPLLPIAEVVSGVPVTRIEAAYLGRQRDLFLITKAGGFGEPDVLSKVRAKLNHAR
jgi:D-threonate/D-erythronate kinase